MSDQASAKVRSGTGKRSMFVRMLVRSTLRRGRTLSALLAMIVAAAAATAMLNLFVDVQAKLHKEFRNYGANVMVVCKNGQPLPADSLDKVESVLGEHGLVVPFGYVVARSTSGQAVVVAGTNFADVQRLNHWWSVSAWPQSSQQALVGVRAGQTLRIGDGPFALNFQGKALNLTSAGTLQTGSSEDSRIFVPLPDFEKWTGLGPSTLQIQVNGASPEIEATIQKLTQALPSADVRPIRQIMQGEADVLGKTRSTMLYSAVLIIATAALCLLATLIGWVYDRRRDFAIMKALGASETLISSFFASEAVVVGMAGALVGYAVGIGAAAWIGRANFHAPVVPRLSVLPPVFAGGVLLALLSTLAPILLLRRVQPANILKGE
jgi:putative ABC transport system permease protein